MQVIPMTLEETLLNKQIEAAAAERRYWKTKEKAAEEEYTYWLFKADHEKNK
jgi:hypothetical protein